MRLPDSGHRRPMPEQSRGTPLHRPRPPNHLHRHGDSMEAIKAGNDTLFILLGAIMVLAMHAGFAFLELGTVRKKNQVNALVKILVDFAVSTIAYFFIGYSDRLRRALLRRRRDAGAEERLRAGQVLLPADLRRGDSGHRLRRHRRARPVQSAARRDLPAGRLRLSVLRGHRLEPALRRAGLAEGRPSARSSTTSPARSSSMRWAAGSAWSRCCCWARAAAATRKDGGDVRAPAVSHPVPRARRVDPDRRLVRLQRHVGADARQDHPAWSRSTR